MGDKDSDRDGPDPASTPGPKEPREMTNGELSNALEKASDAMGRGGPMDRIKAKDLYDKLAAEKLRRN